MQLTSSQTKTGKDEPANTVWKGITFPMNVPWLQPKQVRHQAESPAGMISEGARADGSEEIGRGGSSKICFSWNDGQCAVPYCDYYHICAKCSGEHKAIHCTAYPPLKGSSQPPKGAKE